MRIQAKPLPGTGLHRWFARSFLVATWIATPAVAGESYDACVGFIDTIPAVVSKAGTWCLRQDLSTAISSGNAITIAANNVTIDCNDFKIGNLAAGAATQANGIHVPFATPRANATIRRCNVRGFCRGIRLSGSGHLVEDNRLDNNRCAAISTGGDNNQVRNNYIYNTGGSPQGFASAYQGGALFVGNTISGVHASGTGMSAVGINIVPDGSPVEVRSNTIRDVQTEDPDAQRIGILVAGTDAVITDNLVLSDPGLTPGSSRGIVGDEQMNVACLRNIVSHYATPIESCTVEVDNLTLP